MRDVDAKVCVDEVWNVNRTSVPARPGKLQVPFTGHGVQVLLVP